MEAAWQVPTTVTDAAEAQDRTRIRRRGLGRPRSGCRAGPRARPPTILYGYQVRNNAAVGDDHQEAAARRHRPLPDLDRAVRRAAAPAPGAEPGGRRRPGHRRHRPRLRAACSAWSSEPYYHDTAGPGEAIAVPTKAILSVTENTYDGAGRITKAEFGGLRRGQVGDHDGLHRDRHGRHAADRRDQDGDRPGRPGPDRRTAPVPLVHGGHLRPDPLRLHRQGRPGDHHRPGRERLAQHLRRARQQDQGGGPRQGRQRADLRHRPGSSPASRTRGASSSRTPTTRWAARPACARARRRARCAPSGCTTPPPAASASPPARSGTTAPPSTRR